MADHILKKIDDDSSIYYLSNQAKNRKCSAICELKGCIIDAADAITWIHISSAKCNCVSSVWALAGWQIIEPVIICCVEGERGKEAVEVCLVSALSGEITATVYAEMR